MARSLALLALALVSACTALPTINPDMALRSPKPVQLEGATGPLSVKQSKAILAKLQRNGEDTDIFQRHLAVEQAIVGTPLVVGNKLTLLVDGPATYKSMFAAIDAAKDNINMESYIFDDSEIGQHFASALIAKQLSGVQVNLIYDSLGSIDTPKAFFQPMIDSGINVLEYNPLNPLLTRKGWDLDQRDHRKLLVVDGEIAYVGGINISSVYSSGSFSGSSRHKEDKDGKPEIPWRDTQVRMEGPVVDEFQELFIETWQKQADKPLPDRKYFSESGNKGQDLVRAIGSSPDEPFSLMYATLISAINSAESQIYLTNAYFLPDPQLLGALKDAAARGVDVRLLLPSTTDSNFVFYASRSFYDELLESGIKIYERQDALLHAKTVMIDGVWSTVGSTNLDWRSFVHNQEINAVVLSADFADSMKALFESDLGVSKQITLNEWRHRSIVKRIKEKGARLWARFL